MKKRVVVVGGGYAGVVAALRVARKAADFDVELVTAEPTFVDRIRLHECAARRRDVSFPLTSIFRGSRVSLRIATATAIDASATQVLTRESAISADAIIVAAGSTAKRANRASWTIDLRDTEAIYRAARSKKRILIVGGGLTAIETACELAEAGARVGIASAAPLLGDFHPRVRKALRKVLTQDFAIDVEEGVHVPASDVMHASFDHRIWATGFDPSPLARDSGFAVDGQGRARVSPSLLASGAVFFAGDSASLHPMGCKSALPHGITAADNAIALLRGRKMRAAPSPPSTTCISLGRKRGMVVSPNSPLFIGGKMGAFVKEGVCRYVQWARS